MGRYSHIMFIGCVFLNFTWLFKICHVILVRTIKHLEDFTADCFNANHYWLYLDFIVDFLLPIFSQKAKMS